MRVHSDKLNDRTYSIKVGQSIPPNSVNLAYVDAKELDPRYNVEIHRATDKSSVRSHEIIAEPDENFLLRDIRNGNANISSRQVEVTDEFSIKQNADSSINALYYKAHLSKLFSLERHGVIKNPGYTESTATALLGDPNLKPDKEDSILLYLGDHIQITQNGTPVSKDNYKVILTKVEYPYCMVDIYTNFRNTSDTLYQVTYHSKDGIVTETLNCYPFFSQNDRLISQLLSETVNGSVWDPRLDTTSYSIRDIDGNYQIHAPTHMIVADKDTRPSQYFRYRIESNLDVRYSLNKPCTINIGLAYFNALPTDGDVFDAENVTDILAKVFQHEALPRYVTMQNPHPSYASIDSGKYEDEKHNPNYWLVNLDSPEEFIKDYDIIIITGYGQYDITGYNYVLRKFLENGGSVWLDNGGNGLLAFDPHGDNAKFLIDAKFSSSVVHNTVKQKANVNHKAVNRVWSLDSVSSIGYENINASIELGPSDDFDNWSPVVKYDTGALSIIEKRAYGRGLIVLSNCGIMRAVHGAEDDNIKFFINMLMRLKEDLWVRTPWIHESVLHKDNVFENEYMPDTEGYYEDSYRPEDQQTRIARKLLHKSALDGLTKYVPIDADIIDGKYYVNLEQLAVTENNLMEYRPSSTVKYIPLNSKNNPIYVYTLQKSTNSFNITSEALQNGYFKIYYEPLTVQYTIYAFHYVWDGNVYKKEYRSLVTRETTISKEDGIVNIGLLDELVPELEAGMSEPTKVFFEVSLSYLDERGRVVYTDVPANIAIYDAKTGSFVYNSNGESIISYIDLYYRQNTHNIYLQLWTNYQTIAVNRRRFAVKVLEGESIYLDNSSNLDEAQPWHVRIHNGSYRKSEITKSSELALEFLYDIPEFYSQIYNPYSPYIKVYNEKAQYINYHQVQLANKNLFIDRGSTLGEMPNKVSDTAYKLQHSPIKDITLRDDDGTLSAYSVDREYGIVTPKSSINGTLKADYSWDNIKAVRRRYGKHIIHKEKLEKIDSHTFKAKHSQILLDPLPKLYTKRLGEEMQLIASTDMYIIDYEKGIVKLVNGTSASLYMTYNYCYDEPLTIENYDAINGTLTLKEQIEFTDEILVTYHYEQTYYEYKGYLSDSGVFQYLDINPSEGHTFIYNDQITPSAALINKNIYIYMLPRSISNVLYYTRVPKHLIKIQDGEPVVNILDSSSEWDDVINPINHRRHQTPYIPHTYIRDAKILTGDISHDPDNILNAAVVQKSPAIDSNMGLIPVAVYDTIEEGQVIVGGYLVNNYTIRHTFDKQELDRILENTAGAMLLGTVSVKETDFDITVIDSRSRGGGLKESFSDEFIQQKNGALNLSYWDISTWDGMAYQKNGVLIITLPKEVLQEYGGKFTQNDVEKYINQFIALGVFYIVEYV